MRGKLPEIRLPVRNRDFHPPLTVTQPVPLAVVVPLRDDVHGDVQPGGIGLAVSFGVVPACSSVQNPPARWAQVKVVELSSFTFSLTLCSGVASPFGEANGSPFVQELVGFACPSACPTGDATAGTNTPPDLTNLLIVKEGPTPPRRRHPIPTARTAYAPPLSANRRSAPRYHCPMNGNWRSA